MSYAQYFALEKKIKSFGYDVERSELIDQFTKGQKDSLKALSAWEYKEFISWLQKSFAVKKSEAWKNDPRNIMRRKIIAIFVHKMGYSMAQLDEWCINKGSFHQRLNDHSYDQLVQLVTQAEKVLEWFMNTQRS